MNYYTREEVERFGKMGARSYDKYVEFGKSGAAMAVSRQLSSYWICHKLYDKGLSYHFTNDGFWEAWITLWISRNVSPRSICIDAGANYGYYTFLLAQHGCASVHAIEANPDLIPYLRESVKLNGCKDRVIIHNKAVADVSGRTLKLNLMEGSGDTTIRDSQDSIGNFEVITLALDDLAARLTKVDFVKMDIEGAEQLAWAGMQKLLFKNPNCVVLMEFAKEFFPDAGKAFFAQISKDFRVGYVDFDGIEQSLDYQFMESDTERMRMLIIRRKN